MDWAQVKHLIDCTAELRELVAPGGSEDLFSGGAFPDLLPSLHSSDSSGGSGDEGDPDPPPAAPRYDGPPHRSQLSTQAMPARPCPDTYDPDACVVAVTRQNWLDRSIDTLPDVVILICDHWSSSGHA